MPSPADLTLRDAVVADLGPIAHIVASGPDSCADWTYPDWRDRVEETEPLHLRAFAPLFAARRNLVRVAQRGDGRVVGYCTWVKRDKAAGDEEEVTTVDMREAYDEKELEAEVARLTGTEPLPRFAALMPGIPARVAACKTLREQQSPEPCLSVPSYQLLVLGVAEDQQGLGVGGRLIREGMARAAADGLPVFVTGEGRGMRIYMHYGFQEVKGSWRGFDKDARMLESRGEEEDGEEGWKEEKGGLEARQMVWVPEGTSVEVKGEVYHGQ